MISNSSVWLSKGVCTWFKIGIFVASNFVLVPNISPFFTTNFHDPGWSYSLTYSQLGGLFARILIVLPTFTLFCPFLHIRHLLFRCLLYSYHSLVSVFLPYLSIHPSLWSKFQIDCLTQHVFWWVLGRVLPLCLMSSTSDWLVLSCATSQGAQWLCIYFCVLVCSRLPHFQIHFFLGVHCCISSSIGDNFWRKSYNWSTFFQYQFFLPHPSLAAQWTCQYCTFRHLSDSLHVVPNDIHLFSFVLSFSILAKYSATYLLASQGNSMFLSFSRFSLFVSLRHWESRCSSISNSELWVKSRTLSSIFQANRNHTRLWWVVSSHLPW